MRRKIIQNTIVLLVVLFQCHSCKKEGLGGKATITGFIKHHSLAIPNAMLYIKYGVNELPGTDPSNYDASTNADANAKFEFKDLRKGKYYLFSIGYDSAIFQLVRGGMPIEIKKKNEIKSVDLAVVE